MKKYRGLFVMASTVVLAAGLSSCGSYRVVLPTDASLTGSPAHEKRPRVVGYTTTDGRYHSFESYLAVAGDSLVLTRPAARFVAPGVATLPESAIVLPRGEVASLKLFDGVNGYRTLGVVLLIGLSAYGLLLAVAVNGL